MLFSSKCILGCNRWGYRGRTSGIIRLLDGVCPTLLLMGCGDTFNRNDKHSSTIISEWHCTVTMSWTPNTGIRMRMKKTVSFWREATASLQPVLWILRRSFPSAIGPAMEIIIPLLLLVTPSFSKERARHNLWHWRQRTPKPIKGGYPLTWLLKSRLSNPRSSACHWTFWLFKLWRQSKSVTEST